MFTKFSFAQKQPWCDSLMLEYVRGQRLNPNQSPSLPLTGGGPEPPTDLTTSEVTHYSFRATWVAPDGPVEKYRIEYVSIAGGEPQKVWKVLSVKLKCAIHLKLFTQCTLTARKSKEIQSMAWGFSSWAKTRFLQKSGSPETIRKG